MQWKESASYCAKLASGFLRKKEEAVRERHGEVNRKEERDERRQERFEGSEEEKKVRNDEETKEEREMGSVAFVRYV